MNLPKGVQRLRKKTATGEERIYYYWRATRAKLPDPTSPEFPAALERARQGIGASDAPGPGTFGAMVREWRKSQQYRALRDSSKRVYETILEKLRALDHVQVKEITRGRVLGLRDTLAEHAPAMANLLINVMCSLMQFAVEREWRDGNPLSRIKAIPGGEHKRWPEEAITFALRTDPPTLKEGYRRAILLALYTGQRLGDCLAMRWDQYDGSAIELVQIKTGTAVWLPIHKALREELNTWKRTAAAVTILTNTRGQPWHTQGFGPSFHDAIREHRELRGLVFHGLRKSAAARLAEAGCSTHEIAAITGHKTLQMIQLYTREVDQRRQASAAIARLELVKS